MHPHKVALMLNESATPLLWLQVGEAIKRIGSYLNHPFKIGNIEVSVVSLAIGILVFILALLVSRAISTLIERRIAKRQYIDAGIRYTVARLTHYVILALGLVYALKSAFNLDL